jgi:chitin synthase
MESSEVNLPPLYAKIEHTPNLKSISFTQEIANLSKMHALQLGVGGLSICLTIFNEPGAALHFSLRSLIKNINDLSQSNYADVPLTLCIIVDGLSSVSKSTEQILGSLGFKLIEYEDTLANICISKINTSLEDIVKVVKDNATHYDEDGSYWGSIYRESVNLSRNNRETNIGCKNVSPSVQIILCTKKKNKGKLDSHWWFYNILCSSIEPDFCVQMDVGTTLAREAFLRVLEKFDSDCNIGAVAGKVCSPIPTANSSILYVWQYMQFARTVSVGWAGELSAGYLSVIPGQFSAIRWQAIKTDSGASPLSLSQPLGVYFKGLMPLKPFESILYFSEDRVLCAEIARRADSRWRLAYADTALAVTDPCHTWIELLRQRRRWINGMLASRVKYLSIIPKILMDRSKTTYSKYRTVTAGIYHLFHIALDWCFPSLLIYTYWNLSKSLCGLTGESNSLHTYIIVLSSILFATITTQFFVLYNRILDKWSWSLIYLTLATQVIFILTSLIITVMSGHWFLNGIFIFFLLLVPPMGALKNQLSQASATLKHGIQSIILNAPILLVLSSFATLNVHDNSWGTKGLDKPNYDNSEQRICYINFRFKYIFTYAFSNASLLLALYIFFDNATINFTTLILGLLAADALFCLLSAYWGSCTERWCDVHQNQE